MGWIPRGESADRNPAQKSSQILNKPGDGRPIYKNSNKREGRRPPLPVPTFMPIVEGSSMSPNLQAVTQFLASMIGFAFVLYL